MQACCDMPEDTEVPEKVEKTKAEGVKFSIEIAERICEDIESKPSGLRTICEGNDEYPNLRTFYKWLESSEELRHRYARAKYNQADLLAEQVIEISDDEKRDANCRRVSIDARKWVAGKLRPEKWGDKIEVEHSADDDLANAISGLIEKLPS